MPYAKVRLQFNRKCLLTLRWRRLDYLDLLCQSAFTMIHLPSNLPMWK
jgi:hypothetical protein